MATSEPLRAVQRDTPREAAEKMVEWDQEPDDWKAPGDWPCRFYVFGVLVGRLPEPEDAKLVRAELVAALAAWIEEDRRTR